MSMRSPLVYIVPEDTQQAARASFPKGHPLMTIADNLGPIYANAEFAPLFSPTGQPAYDPARLALVTIFQFMEGLSDQQAADAVRGHLAWKYALALPLHDPGFDSSVLSEFRARLLGGGLEMLLLEALLEQVRELGLLKARGRMRTDSTHILSSVRTVSRLITCGETLRAALNAIAEQEPNWLAAIAPAEWFEYYSRRVEDFRLPKAATARAAMAAEFGADGHELLTGVYAAAAPPALRQLPAVQVLRTVWLQQYYAPDEAGQVLWRTEQDLPPSALQILSPYDSEARCCTKGSTTWVGYKVHISESCDEETPHLITNVHTTAATVQDEQALEPIHEALKRRQMLPGEHLVDAGYVDGLRLVQSSNDYAVELLGPAPIESSWQARAAAGYAASCFAIDWHKQQVRCPAGKQSREWKPVKREGGREEIHVEFRRRDCMGCGVRAACTKAETSGRTLHLLPREQHLALAGRREEQKTAEFKRAYAARAGVEATISQGIRVGDLRRSRYRGLAKSGLQQILIAVAVNLLRLVAWWTEEPRRGTRVSAFAALAERQWRPASLATAGQPV